VSYSELPGAFAFQGIPHLYSAAEACIHEFHHNRLFCLEECEPILAGDALGTEDHAGYYSPWREGLRPLRGILHGAYVTAAQLRFWLAVARAPDTEGMLADFVTGQLIRQPVVVDLGLGQLERHARFTEERLYGAQRARPGNERRLAGSVSLGPRRCAAPGGRFGSAAATARGRCARHRASRDELAGFRRPGSAAPAALTRGPRPRADRERAGRADQRPVFGSIGGIAGRRC
jgi:hypothetical protein